MNLAPVPLMTTAEARLSPITASPHAPRPQLFARKAHDCDAHGAGHRLCGGRATPIVAVDPDDNHTRAWYTAAQENRLRADGLPALQGPEATKRP